MKRIITLLLCALLILPTFSVITNANSEPIVTNIGYQKGRLDYIEPEKSLDMTAVKTKYDITQLAPGILSYTDIESVILPEHLDYIPTQAFSGCEKLTSVTVPLSCTKIDDYAFSDCSALKTITIGQFVKEIGEDIFEGCSEDLIVKVYGGSAIYNYCFDNSIPMEIIDEGCPHAVKITQTVTEPTCTENGIYVEKCTSCGLVRAKGNIIATGHKVGSWKMTDGEREGVCIYCNAHLYSFIDKDVHIPFTDVEKDSWYEPYAKFCYSNNLISGTSSTNYSPYVTTNRAMIVRILASYCGADLSKYSYSAFPDVAEGQWYTAAITWANENGIVSGFENNTFRPANTLTREQMAVILMNFAKFCGYDTTVRADISTFADGDTVSSWAYDALSFAVANKIINGTGKNKLSPKGYATRAQLSTVIKNFADKYEKAKYERVVIIALDGAGNYIKDAKTTNIDKIFKSYTAKTESNTDCMSSFNSILSGSAVNNSVISKFGVEYLNNYKNYGTPTIFSSLENSNPNKKAASFCANENINKYIISDSDNLFKYNSDGYDEELCNELCEKNGYLENNDPALLFVHFTQIERAAEHFSGGYGSKDYLTQIELTDAYVGEIYDKYVSLGRADSTLFLLVCDSAGATGTKTHYTEANDVYFGVDKNSANENFTGTLKITDTAGITLKALGAQTGGMITSIPKIIK